MIRLILTRLVVIRVQVVPVLVIAIAMVTVVLIFTVGLVFPVVVAQHGAVEGRVMRVRVRVRGGVSGVVVWSIGSR